MLSTIGYLSPWLVLGVVLFMGWLPMVLKIGSIGIVFVSLYSALLNKDNYTKNKFFILLGISVGMGILMYFMSNYLIIQIFIVGLYIWRYFNLTKVMKYYEHNGYVNVWAIDIKSYFSKYFYFYCLIFYVSLF